MILTRSSKKIQNFSNLKAVHREKAKFLNAEFMSMSRLNFVIIKSVN